MLGQLLRGPRLVRHHVRVELRRPPDRLTGVVDDEVQAWTRGDQVAAKCLDAWQVPKIEPEDLEAIAPVAEVGFLRVARRRILRKPGRDDQPRAGAQQLQAGLIPDLHPPARQQRDPAAQIGQLGSRREVDRRAVGAQLIVKVMQVRVRLLADVADAIDRWRGVGRRRACSTGGGNTFGVVTTGRRRRARMPVSLRIASSRRTSSARAALRRLRFAAGSAVDSAAIARCRR